MKHDQGPADREIEQILTEFRASCPPRQSEAASRARTRFLCEVEALRQSRDERAQRTIASRFGRLFNWRREDAHMLRVIAAIVLAVTTTLGGAGLTVNASQRALPRQSLYPVKLLTENVRTAVAFDDAQAAELQVDFAIERADEVLALAQQGNFEALDEAVERLEGQLERATEALEELWETNPEEAAQLATRLEGKLAEVAAALEQLPLEGAPEKAREIVAKAIDVTRDGQQEVLELLGEDVPEVEDDEDDEDDDLLEDDDEDDDLTEEDDDEETPEIEESDDDSEIEEDEIDDVEDDDAEEQDEEIDDSVEDDEHDDGSSIEDDEPEETDDSSEHEEDVETDYTSGDHEQEEYDD